MSYFVISKSDYDILHYGVKHRSGRYPYGSGERPYQDRERPIVKLKRLRQEVREKKAARNKYNKNYSEEDRALDISAYGRSGVKRINRRMNSGDSYKKAAIKELGLQIAAGTSVSAVSSYSIYAILRYGSVKKAMAMSIRNAINNYSKYKSQSRARKTVTKIGAYKLKKVGKNVYKFVM